MLYIIAGWLFVFIMAIVYNVSIENQYMRAMEEYYYEEEYE